jgi:oligopeptide/dipeptide ABC transporter ATP-binding protein
MSPVLEVEGLRTYFHTRKGVVKAVDNVSFTIQPGEIMGLVGESGAGKTITGFSLINLIDSPGRIEGGRVVLNGRDLIGLTPAEFAKIRGREAAMIFQDPQTSLNPVLTIRRQMYETLRYHNPDMSSREMRDRSLELLKAVGLPAPEERLNAYPHQLSGGMKQRIVIAMALLNDPKLLIADEPTTALDVTIQAQILHLMKRLCHEFNSSMVLITHDIGVVSQMCDHVAVMYGGRIVEQGTKRQVLRDPRHPYTQGLIACLPKLNESQPRLDQIKGVMPSLLSLPDGCYFRDRCPWATEQCKVYPETRDVGGRNVACHHAK